MSSFFIVFSNLTFQSEERLPMKFSRLVEFVSKKPIPPHVKDLIVEVMVSDEDGEDVEVRSTLGSAYDSNSSSHRFLSLLFIFDLFKQNG